MDQYVSYLSNKDLLFKNIVFRGERIITAKEITEYFYSFLPPCRYRIAYN